MIKGSRDGCPFLWVMIVGQIEYLELFYFKALALE